MAQLSYSAYLEATRVDHHISVKTLCRYVGFSPATYHRILRGESSPKVREFCRWVDFMMMTPGSEIGEKLNADYFRLTTVEDRTSMQLLAAAPLRDAAGLRETLTAVAAQTGQSDYDLLVALIDLRQAAPAARPAIARRVVTALRQRQHWAYFELRCFLVAAPYLSWSIVSHCMAQYATGTAFGAAGEAAQRHSLGYQELLLIAYVRAAANTHICENVVQACSWYGQTFSDASQMVYDGRVFEGLTQDLVTLFAQPQATRTAIAAVCEPRVTVLTAWQDDAPHRVTDRVARLQEALLAGGPYHHDGRLRHRPAAKPVPVQRDVNFGLRFTALRRGKGVSVKDLCRLSGISRGVYRRFCDGSNTLRLDQLCRLLDCCHIGLPEFFSFKDLPGNQRIRDVMQSHLVIRLREGLTAADEDETEQLHQFALDAGSPFFLNLWRLVRTVDVEGSDDNSAALPIAQAALAQLMSYDTWNYHDYILFGDLGGYADMQTARLVMQRLLKSIATPNCVITQVPMQTNVTLWVNLLLVAYRTHEVAAVLTVTDAIQGLATPQQGGPNTLAWSILRRYAAYVAAVVTAGPTKAAPAWLRLCQQIKTLMTEPQPVLLAILGGNHDLLMASDLWPVACEAGNPPQVVTEEDREFMGTAKRAQPQ
ncbi:helix-turn-helix domain-containing protein [Lacticaseibacillus parakribbianus]|uniref:helix-turn-helix domain-containing protein n=1 Tax=Lacticaseibacillus parakribbianus TaxID=2970927 RepID=UPI0021CB50EA|nr:helix-turn-helix transcriptional regulator [Lacticaseibacillus parakribbianus]